MNNIPSVDFKQLYDIKIFEKALKIIKSKSKKKKEKYFSRTVQRYDIALNSYDIIGCAQIINELKPYFDGTIKKKDEDDGMPTYQALLLAALRNITQISVFHKTKNKQDYWPEFFKFIEILKIPETKFNFEIFGHIFSEWPKAEL